MATVTTPAPKRASSERRYRSGLLTGLLILPAGLWYLILLVAPIAIVILFSFGRRGATGGYGGGFTLDNYGGVLASRNRS